jgi:rhodanese-related sulfurtransferase
MDWWKKDLPKGLALLAAALGAFALVTRDPSTPRRATVDLVQLATDVERGADHVTAFELHDLVKGKKVRVIDLRAANEYAASHIPDAENVPLSRIHEINVRRDEHVVLYSGGGIHSSQAWFLLRARGVQDVKFLVGGYDEWVASEAPPTPVAQAAPPAAAAPNTAPPTTPAAAPVPVQPAARSLFKSAAAATKPAEPAAAPATPANSEQPAPAKKPREGC